MTVPEEIDISLGQFGCIMDAGCIQNVNHSNGFGAQAVNSYRWLPEWSKKITLPDGLDLTKQYIGPSRNKRVNFIDCPEPSASPRPPSTLAEFRVNNYIGLIDFSTPTQGNTSDDVYIYCVGGADVGYKCTVALIQNGTGGSADPVYYKLVYLDATTEFGTITVTHDFLYNASHPGAFKIYLYSPCKIYLATGHALPSAYLAYARTQVRISDNFTNLGGSVTQVDQKYLYRYIIALYDPADEAASIYLGTHVVIGNNETKTGVSTVNWVYGGQLNNRTLSIDGGAFVSDGPLTSVNGSGGYTGITPITNTFTVSDESIATVLSVMATAGPGGQFQALVNSYPFVRSYLYLDGLKTQTGTYTFTPYLSFNYIYA